MATHSSVLAWKIPWTVEPGGTRLSAHTLFALGGLSWSLACGILVPHPGFEPVFPRQVHRQQRGTNPTFLPGIVSGHHHGKSCPLKGFLTSRWLTSLQAGAIGNFDILAPLSQVPRRNLKLRPRGEAFKDKKKRLKREIKKQTTPLPQSSLPPPPPPPPYSTNKNKPKKKTTKNTSFYPPSLLCT